jgi:hypothetical protein
VNTLAKVNALVADGDFVSTSRTITINGTSNEIATTATNQDLTADRPDPSLPAVIDLGGKTRSKSPTPQRRA